MIDELELALSPVGVCQRWTVSMAELTAVRGRAAQWTARQKHRGAHCRSRLLSRFQAPHPVPMWYLSGWIRRAFACRFPVGEDHGIVLLNGGGLEAPQ